jgi:hypothetical protein
MKHAAEHIHFVESIGTPTKRAVAPREGSRG